MTSKTFDIDATHADYEARRKALAAKKDATLARVRNQVGSLVHMSKVANGHTPESLLGMLLWAEKQGQANPGLKKKWAQAGATFLGKSSADGAGSNGGNKRAGSKPAAKPESDRPDDAGPADLLARVAAE